MEFKLWLEFEHVDPGNSDIENECANIFVDLPDDRQYGINVWTYKFFEPSIKQDKENGENLSGLYQTAPDVFVMELTRECIEKTIADLLEKGDLEDVLNPTIIASKNKTCYIKVYIVQTLRDKHHTQTVGRNSLSR